MFQIKSKKVIDKETAKKIVALGISLRDSLATLENKCIEEYDETKTYIKDKYVTYDGYLWKSKVTTTGTWNESKWEKEADDLSLITLDNVKAMVGLNDEEIETLSKIILDSEIRLDKTFSSSKIYSDIQNAISEGKTYTLEQFAKVSKASYHVVTTTAEMTDTSVIYLLQNGSNFDMYITEDGTNAKKIGDTNIDLSDYVKLTDLADYLKTTDADGKYALITTVDGKIDKTSISTSMSTTPSDEKVLSEKAVKTELDKKANDSEVVKFENIINALDNSSTEKELLSAKGLYEILSSNVVETYNTSEDTVSDIVSGLRTIKGTLPIKVIRLYDDNKKIFEVAGNYLGIVYHPNNQNEIGCYFVNHWNPSVVYSAKIEDNDTQLKVSKLCTTSVADVPLTKIDLSITQDVTGGEIYYTVENGICFVNFLNIAFLSSDAKTDILPAGTLPKASHSYYWFPLCGVKDQTYSILVHPTLVGSLSQHINVDTTKIYTGGFSYIVAKN